MPSYLSGVPLQEFAPALSGLPRLHWASPSTSLDKRNILYRTEDSK